MYLKKLDCKQVIDNDRYDIIFIDVVLDQRPGQNNSVGIACARLVWPSVILAISLFRNTSILVITASSLCRTTPRAVCGVNGTCAAAKVLISLRPFTHLFQRDYERESLLLLLLLRNCKNVGTKMQTYPSPPRHQIGC